MKVFKLVLFNVIGLLLLLVLLELFCQLSGAHFFKPESYNSVMASRFQKQEMNQKELSDEFGQSSFKMPPASLKLAENSSLEGYSYGDIDQSPEKNRQWSWSKDGFIRSSRFIKKIKGTSKEVYNVLYRLNPLDKRVVENQDSKTQTTSFVLAAGDSYTFGEGVDQGQDYPSQLASLLSADRFVYNYGISGDSANDFAYRATLDSQFFFPIKEQKGVFIWLYNDAQMQRLVYPTTAYSLTYINAKAEYTLDDGELVFHGFFNNSNRFKRKIINGLAGLALTKSFNLELPKVYTKDHYELFIKLLNLPLAIMEQTGKQFEKKILVLYTSHYNTADLKQAAESNGFEVLYFEKLLYKRDKTFGGNMNLSLPVDGHPSPDAYWLLAQVLKEKYFN